MSRKVGFVSIFVLFVMAFGFIIVEAQGPKPTPPKPKAPTANAGTAFTYQGQLKNGGSAVNGSCDFTFGLWDASSAGNQIGSTQNANAVSVANGLFTAQIDFGASAFQGDARFLETAVRCPAGSGSFTTLSRQALTPAPIAFSLPGLYTQQNTTSPNVIGGYSGNTVDGGVVGATIGGGGQSGLLNRASSNFATIGGGVDNTASGNFATIGGGKYNTASGDTNVIGGGYNNTTYSNYTTVGGGYSNTASGYFATISGGASITASGSAATVGGGSYNTASGDVATIGGGSFNTASGNYAIIGGGTYNIATGEDATIGGGNSNTTNGFGTTVGGGNGNYASGGDATIGGGYNNTAIGGGATIGGGDNNFASGGYDPTVGGGVYNTASGQTAMVPGGYSNTAAGDFSFAAGYKAWARYPGSFVWNDSVVSGSPFADSQANEFNVRSSGGVRFFTSDNYTTGCTIAAGGGSWSCTSDRNAKSNFANLDGREILAQLSNIPIQTWNYKTQDASIRHIGPMAQDFYAAFNVGEDDKHISTVDEEGVALAAIQGLYQMNQEQATKIALLEKENATLKQQNTSFESRLTTLEQTVQVNNAPAHSDNTGNVAMIVIGALLGIVVVQKPWRRGEQ